MPFRLEGCNLDSRKVEQVATYTANASDYIELPTNKNVTFMRGKLTVNYDTATTLSATEDGLAKLVSGPTILVNQSIRYCECPSLQMAALYSRWLNRGRGDNDQPSTTAGQSGVTGEVEFFYLLSLNPMAKEDPHVAIPCQHEEINSLRFSFSWGNNSTLGTGYTVNATTKLEITDITGWICDRDHLEFHFPKDRYLRPNWVTHIESFTGAKTNYSLEVKLPTRQTIRTIFIIVKDSNGNRSNSIVTGLRLKLYNNVDAWGPYDWDEIQRQMADFYDISTPDTGTLLIDCRRLQNVTGDFFTDEGIEIEKDSDLVLGFTTSAAGSVEILFDNIIVVESPLK